MTKRAGLYARVARGEESGSNHNLTSQLVACREYAISHGWTIVAELHEDERGASGLARDLPQLAQIRRMAQDGDFDVLVVRDRERISRDAAWYLAVEQELQQAGVQIACVSSGPGVTVTPAMIGCSLAWAKFRSWRRVRLADGATALERRQS